MDLDRFGAFARKVGAVTPPCNTCNTRAPTPVLQDLINQNSVVTPVTPVTPQKSEEENEAELQALYEERSAIMEYDGGLTRQDAETAAWQEVFGDRPRP
ncbi:hypothetical protein [Neomegalonema sp.]|uniref:hypothetical protein n=1 Tax=Neomegalonema sp. TaxID=2039713 RepID=UPI002639BBD0|nr:hypothetical protein [Neomegalonema sp.]MDD2869741.1 hypothetical protein [Neomegalonema sp.]